MIDLHELPEPGAPLREINQSHFLVVEKDLAWAAKLQTFQRDPARYIVNRVVLAAVPEKALKVAVMLSGGEDSSFLLDVIRRSRPKVKLYAFSAATVGNGADIARARVLCNRLDVPLRIVKPQKGELSAVEAAFCNKFGRHSRDPAQAVHNYLSGVITAEVGDALVLDGQFCDTVLHSNPHNTLLLAYKRMGSAKLAVPLANRLLLVRKAGGRSGKRLLTALELLGEKSSEEFILRACGIAATSESLALARQLVLTFNEQTALTALFFWVTTRHRERDKYLLPLAEYVLPFDSQELFWLASYSFGLMTNMFIRKRPIHSYLVGKHPDLFNRQRTLPFEPR